MRKPWFRFFASDWISDARLGALTLMEQGAYIRLLAIQWREGFIPSDHVSLFRLIGLGPIEEYSSPAYLQLENVTQFFKPDADDPTKLRNRRLEIVRQESEEDADIRSKNGRKGAIMKKKLGLSRAKAELLANAQLNTSIQSQIQIQIQSQSQKTETEKTNPPKPPRKRGSDGAGFHENAAEVLGALNIARSKVLPDCRELKAIPSNLRHISDRLREGASLDDCMHVIAVCAAEVKHDPKAAQWFDAVTPFRPDNFARKVARTGKTITGPKTEYVITPSWEKTP